MVKTFKIIAWLEGISYILLLFVAVPIKYLSNDPKFVRMLGMPHGLFFVGYIALAVLLKVEYKWRLKNFLILCVLSLLPLGTFFIKRFMEDNRSENENSEL